MRKQTYPNQPTDDVLEIIKNLVELKRQGKFEDANKGYSKLAEEEKNDTHNYPYVLKSWAKVLLCQGEYDKTLEFLETATKLFQNNGNEADAWQCNDQAKIVRNRYKNRNEFIDYVKAVSGGVLDFPKNY